MKICSKTKILCIASTIALIAISCSMVSTQPEEAEVQQICTLSENLSRISRPMSFAMTSSGGFVMCDNDKVFLYSMDGRQIRQIGQAGRARFEYNHPSKVAVYNDTIYVWSSFTATFITYTLDGTPVAQYRYNSAITNFEPAGDYIFIYTGGRADENVIDVYSTVEKNVVKSISKATDEHRLLLFNMAASPLFYDGTLLYYSSLDVPDIYTYDPSQETPTLFSKVKSQTFHVEKSDISIRNNRSKQLDYSITNSQVLNIFPNGASLYVMALEGTACLENDKYQTEDKFFTVYGASEKNNFVASYSYDSIGTELLFDSTSDGLYFIRHTIENGEDVYTLNKLIID